jgi:serine/threonine protein kinase
LAPLGAGGIGEVYRTRDPRLGREVAIKVLAPEAVTDQVHLRRFVAEAKAVSALNHPNILTLHEIGEFEGGPYIVTELVDGETIRSRLRSGPLPVNETLDLALQVTAGLAKAHEAAIVHRDLKPDNLMRNRDGIVKILDFGLAKLMPSREILMQTGEHNITAAGIVVGTPAYLSPEQLQGQQADCRSDVFSFGVVLYEAFAGTNPFVRDTMISTLQAVLSETPEPLHVRRSGVPAELVELVDRCMAKDRDKRYADALELRDTLQNLNTTSGAPYRAPRQRPKSRRRWLAPAVGALVVTAGLFGASMLWQSGRKVETATPETARSSPAFEVPFPEGKLGVAILPIRDQAGDPSLADAGIGRILTDAFVQILADHPDLYVISPHRLAGITRTMGRTFAETDTDLDLARDVALQAESGAMLTGAFSRLGDTYILAATLTELPSGVVIDQFRVQCENVECVLTELTEGVSRQVRETFPTAMSTPEAPPQSVPTHSIEAYAHYVRGDDLIQEARWQDAVEELKLAVDIDPEMALAWSALSCAYSFNGDDTHARAAALKADDFLDRVNERERRWIELDNIWVNTENGDLYLSRMSDYIRDYPDDRDSYFYAGLAEEYLKQNPAAALSWYEKAYDLIPLYYPVTKAIVDCQLKLERSDLAIQALHHYLSQPHLSADSNHQATGRLQELEQRR